MITVTKCVHTDYTQLEVPTSLLVTAPIIDSYMLRQTFYISRIYYGMPKSIVHNHFTSSKSHTFTDAAYLTLTRFVLNLQWYARCSTQPLDQLQIP